MRDLFRITISISRVKRKENEKGETVEEIRDPVRITRNYGVKSIAEDIFDRFCAIIK